MGSNWSLVDNNFPTFTGQENLKEQVKLLHDFLPIMIESLKYQLNNLDASNWNATAMQTFQEDTTRELETAMDTTDTELARLIYSMEELQRLVDSMTARMGDLESDTALLEKWKSEAAEQIGRLQDTVDEIAADVDALGQVVAPDAEGATIGAEGMTIRLVGRVYLNGVLLQA